MTVAIAVPTWVRVGDGPISTPREAPDPQTDVYAEAEGSRRHRLFLHSQAYFVFDLLFLDGKKVGGLPLLERKERLRAIWLKEP